MKTLSVPSPLPVSPASSEAVTRAAKRAATQATSEPRLLQWFLIVLALGAMGLILVLPLFSELEFLGVKVKKEVKKAVEKSNEEVKASLNNLQQLVSQIQVSNSVAPQFTINGGPLPSEERIDNLIKEIHLLNEQNKDKQVEQRDEITIPASNLELFKMRYEIEIRIREALELIGYTGKNRTSLMQATYYLNQQGVLDPTSTDLIIQMLRIANRGVHGEIIGQKYMDFASQAYPQIIDGLDNCKEQIKRMT